jgi:hypothetical protein
MTTRPSSVPFELPFCSGVGVRRGDARVIVVIDARGELFIVAPPPFVSAGAGGDDDDDEAVGDPLRPLDAAIGSGGCCDDDA